MYMYMYIIHVHVASTTEHAEVDSQLEYSMHVVHVCVCRVNMHTCTESVPCQICPQGKANSWSNISTKHKLTIIPTYTLHTGAKEKESATLVACIIPRRHRHTERGREGGRERDRELERETAGCFFIVLLSAQPFTIADS